MTMKRLTSWTSACLAAVAMACSPTPSASRSATNPCDHALTAEALVRARLTTIGASEVLEFSNRDFRTEYTKVTLTTIETLWGPARDPAFDVYVRGAVQADGNSSVGRVSAGQTDGFWVINAADGKSIVPAAGLYVADGGEAFNMDHAEPFPDFAAQMTEIHGTRVCPASGSYAPILDK